jgi:hypothetical protein
MRAFSSSAVLAAFLVAGVQGASADSLQTHIQNHTPYRMEVQFYSYTKGGVWPGHGQVYIQSDNEIYDYVLTCSPGEKICMGASAQTPQGPQVWGYNSHTRTCITNCCWFCGENARLLTIEDTLAPESDAAAPPSSEPPDPAQTYVTQQAITQSLEEHNRVMQGLNSDLLSAMRRAR